MKANYIVRMFGLRGSWGWAVRQMRKGEIVKPKGITGSVKYRISPDEGECLQWIFVRFLAKKQKHETWKSANFFPARDMCSKWEIV